LTSETNQVSGQKKAGKKFVSLKNKAERAKCTPGGIKKTKGAKPRRAQIRTQPLTTAKRVMVLFKSQTKE